MTIHFEVLNNPCGCQVGTCKSELRLYLIKRGKVEFADQYISALGENCDFCGLAITNQRLGHICNCSGKPEHDDCNPDRD